MIAIACNFAKKLTGHISEAIHHWSLILHVSYTFNHGLLSVPVYQV